MKKAKYSLPVAVLLFLSLVFMAAASVAVFAGDVESAEAPAGRIEVWDEFSPMAWGLNSDKDVATLYSAQHPENELSEYKEMSYDKEKATLFLKNNASKSNAFILQIHDMGALTIDVTGNCELVAIDASNTQLTITGSGTLTLNPGYNLVGKKDHEEDTPENRDVHINWSNLIGVEKGTLTIDNGVTIICNDGVGFYITNHSEGTVTVDDVFTCLGKPSEELDWEVLGPGEDGYHNYQMDSTYHIYHRFPAGKIYKLEGDEGENNYWIISNMNYESSSQYYMSPLVEKNGRWYEDLGAGYYCSYGSWYKTTETVTEYGRSFGFEGEAVQGLSFVPYDDFSEMPESLVSDGYAEANVSMEHTNGGTLCTKDGKRFIMVGGVMFSHDTQHFWVNKRLEPVEPTVPEGEKELAFALLQVHTDGEDSWLTFEDEILTSPETSDVKYVVDGIGYEYNEVYYVAIKKLEDIGYEFPQTWVPGDNEDWIFRLQNSNIRITPDKKAITPSVKLDKTSYVYDGSVKHPAVTVYSGSTKLTDADYTVAYPDGCKDVGDYDVTVTLKGKYSGKGSESFSITKAAQSMKAKASKKTVKYKKVKKKAQNVSGAIKVSGAKGTVTYEKVSKGSDKKLSVNKTTGKITVKKGTKKGKHKIVVKVKASGGKNYKSATKKVTVTITVK